jgi:hypothetical protein
MYKRMAILLHVSEFSGHPQHVFNEEIYNTFSYCIILLLNISVITAEKMPKHVAGLQHVSLFLYLITPCSVVVGIYMVNYFMLFHMYIYICIYYSGSWNSSMSNEIS